MRGDTGPSNRGPNALNPIYSVLTSASGYSGTNSTAAPTVVNQYCNGTRVPPTCSVAEGCGGPSGYGVPPGIVDATSPNPVFSLTPAATVDEGNNWINVSWGPLALSDPSVNSGTTGNWGSGPVFANYNLTTNFDPIASTVAPPNTDFNGNPRPPSRFNPGAVEFQGSGIVAAVSVTPTQLAFAAVAGTTSASQTLTVSNTGGAAFTGAAVAVAGPGFARPGGGAGGNCGATLAAGATCTINITFSPAATASGSATGSVTITGSVAVTGSPVALAGIIEARVRTITVTPNPLAFGTWFAGTESNSKAVTVTNTGNVALAGGTFTFGGGAPQPFSRNGGSCGGGLAVGASCTVNVRFTAPAAAGAVSRTLTVNYTGLTPAATVVTLTGTSVTGTGTQGTLSFNAPGVTLASGVDLGSTVVTVTNTSATTSVAITGDPVTGSGFTGTAIWVYGDTANGCVPAAGAGGGVNLAPGASCTVTIGIIRFGAAGLRPATVTFADTAVGSPNAVSVPITLN